LVTGSKDKQARIWKFETEENTRLNFSCEERNRDREIKIKPLPRIKCIGVCSGHTETIGGIAISQKSQSFMITGSEDKTVKFWDLNPLLHPKKNKPALQPVAKYTKKAHDKDINCVAIAPNDKLFATGSQDKFAKLWNVEDGSLLGTFQGHKRGVWCVSFSPVDKVLATSSGDKTIKIWSLTDFSCLRVKYPSTLFLWNL